MNKMSLNEEMYWESVDKTALPSEEVIARRAINASFVAEWKKATHQTEQKTLAGEVAVQCKQESEADKVKRRWYNRQHKQDKQMTVDEMDTVHRIVKGIQNDWNTHE